ncbi:MAG: tetratricopeptide repeat protein [Anaerolineae bacterium]|nr:tetratricopeptide repeat protein [Anaerolineae bacterium]
MHFTALSDPRYLRRSATRAILALILITTSMGVALGSAPVQAQDMPPDASPTPETPTPTPEPFTPTPPPMAAQLGAMTHTYQTWNNCSGANLTMALSYFGWNYDQDVARAWLKPNVEDKNVSPKEMVDFVNYVQTDLPHVRALWRYGGDLDLIKRLVAAGFPVIAEAGFDVDDLDWMGHYETVSAYDDTTQTIWVADSYKGPNQSHTYEDFDYWWRHFNRAFVVLFDLDRVNELAALLGDYYTPEGATQIALAQARAEAQANPNDAWAWFNMGTSYVRLGNYADAATAFDEAFRLQQLPYRLLWYMFGPYEAYYNMGRYDDVVQLAANTESTTTYVEEIMFWRGMVYAARGQNDLAINEFNKVLAFNPNAQIAQEMKTQVETGTFTPPV